ncbi:MAG: hypothetical protein FJX78_09185 [Armatimonadetes bacterium]|nr:hypothetical protein [Armatimonadota bacterium]
MKAVFSDRCERTCLVPLGRRRWCRSILAWVALVAFTAALAASAGDPNATERDPYHTHAVVAATPEVAAEALTEHHRSTRRNRAVAKRTSHPAAHHHAAPHPHASPATGRETSGDGLVPSLETKTVDAKAHGGALVVSVRGDGAAATGKVTANGATSATAYGGTPIVPPERQLFRVASAPPRTKTWDRMIPIPPPERL